MNRIAGLPNTKSNRALDIYKTERYPTERSGGGDAQDGCSAYEPFEKVAGACQSFVKRGGRPRFPVDETTSVMARGLLRKLFTNFAGSNCDHVFNQVIGGYNIQQFEAEANATQFYNVTDSAFASLKQNQVVGNGNQTSLAETRWVRVRRHSLGHGGKRGAVGSQLLFRYVG
jgi:hypothetical protein